MLNYKEKKGTNTTPLETCFVGSDGQRAHNCCRISKMADAKPEVGIASTREQRRNAGNLMSKLIEDEQDVDDFYKTAFGGFEEESGDEQYDTEEEVEDVVDSDFSMSETDEVIDEGIDDEPKRKRKPVQVKSYKPRKLDDDTAESKEAKTTPRKTRRSDLPAREGIRKSTRSLTVERSQVQYNVL